MRGKKRLAFYALLALLLAPLAPAQLYTVSDLRTLGGSSSVGMGINDFGQVVGESSTVSGLTTHAFLWTKGKGMHDLGTLGGCYSQAEAINLFGHVVGGSSRQDATFPSSMPFCGQKPMGWKT